jgi:hypothetical protein
VEVERYVARGVDHYQKSDAGREQRVENGEPVQLDGEAQIQGRCPRNIHRSPAREPTVQGGPECQCCQRATDRRRERRTDQPDECRGGRGQDSQNQRRENLERRQRQPPIGEYRPPARPGACASDSFLVRSI